MSPFPFFLLPLVQDLLGVESPLLDMVLTKVVSQARGETITKHLSKAKVQGEGFLPSVPNITATAALPSTFYAFCHNGRMVVLKHLFQ